MLERGLSNYWLEDFRWPKLQAGYRIRRTAVEGREIRRGSLHGYESASEAQNWPG